MGVSIDFLQEGDVRSRVESVPQTSKQANVGVRRVIEWVTLLFFATKVLGVFG